MTGEPYFILPTVLKLEGTGYRVYEYVWMSVTLFRVFSTILWNCVYLFVYTFQDVMIVLV